MFSLSLFAPENLVSRDGFCSPVPRQPAHLHILRLNVMFSNGILPDFRGGVSMYVSMYVWSSHTCMYVCMDVYVWSSHIAEYGSTG